MLRSFICPVTNPIFQGHRNCLFFSIFMSLINIASILDNTLRVLKKTEPPGGVELLSYKRNRSIAIIKKNTAEIRLQERGYREKEIETTMPQLTKELKAMIKREFPRSRKVRMVKFSDPKVLEHPRQII